MPAKKPSLYSVHPSVRLMEHWVDELEAKTGRTLEAWTRHIKAKGPDGEEARRAWLKSEYGLGTNTAWWLAERSVGKTGDEDTEAGYLRAAPVYVEAMYDAKPGLRPIHDAVVNEARKLGKDVKVCPCQTIVPLYRKHVFAQIKPSTKMRLDLGLYLTPLMKAGKKVPARLIDTGGFEKKDRITHRIGLGSVAEFDGEAREWLARAYALDG